MTNHLKHYLAVGSLLTGMSLPLLHAEIPNGSTGTDGALNVTADQTLQIPADGVFNYTTIDITAGATLTFTKNALNTPIYLFATGDVTIEGTIDISGGDGGPNTIGLGGAGGGFDGGAPPSSELPAGYGKGPGGGSFTAAHATEESGGAQAYGNPACVPPTPGSGGAGNLFGTTGFGGGGGGGALVIASGTCLTVNGQILSRGGGGQRVQKGSGGCIRLVAPVVKGSGTVDVTNGSGTPHAGRIRVDTYDRTGLGLNYMPAASTSNVSQGTFVVARLLPAPTLEIADVGGLGAGSSLVFPTGSAETQSVSVAAANFGEAVEIEIVLKPTHGPALDPAFATISDNATTPVDVDIPANTPLTVEVYKR